jgi:hypothetical protein
MDRCIGITFGSFQDVIANTPGSLALSLDTDQPTMYRMTHLDLNDPLG